MAKVLITDSILTDLASAIRSKNGSTATYTPSEMVSAISNFDPGLTRFITNRSLPMGFHNIYYNSTISTIGAGAFASAYVSSVECQNVSIVSQGAFRFCYQLLSISLSTCTRVMSEAFYNCVNLSSVYMPELSSVGMLAFGNCSRLSTISFSLLTSMDDSGFDHCDRVSAINLPMLTTVGGYGFRQCGNSVSDMIISLPLVTSVKYSAFQYANFTSVYLPECTTVGSTAFASNRGLTTVNLPKATFIGENAFSACSALNSVNLPEVTSMNAYVFANCSSLSSIKLLKLQWANYAFYSAKDIKTIILRDIKSLIGSTFCYCQNLLSLYLLGSSIATLSSRQAFTSTPISTYTTSTGGVYGSIFVPASLYDSQKTATNWTYYSARFASLTDAQISAILNS